MSELAANRFHEAPEASIDDDGWVAYVRVTAATATAAAAREWLITDERGWEVIHHDPAERRIRPERIHVLGMSLELKGAGGVIPHTLDLERQIREGLVSAWWEFDVSMAVEELPELRARWKAELARRHAESRRRARECRGPWWWRVRCEIAETADELSEGLRQFGRRLMPNDRVDVGFPDGRDWVTVRTRRPTDG